MSNPLLLRFIAEARDLLQGAATGLLALEKRPGDDAAINEVFRAVHTLKGSVGLFDFPAFARLVHAGEDVLSAVRIGEIGLTSDLVDLLLDSLDQVSHWVDLIQQTGVLPEDADGVSHRLSATLRAVLPQAAAADAPAPEAGAGLLTGLDWLADLPESARLAGFAASLAGQSLIAIDYAPAEDCFFSGEDPLSVFRGLAPLYALDISARDPWPAPGSLDPYRCNLRFRALTSAPASEIETLFRYVIEQIKLAPIAPARLIGLTGTPQTAPVYEDFVEAARSMAAAADWSGLDRAAATLQELSSPTLRAASSLRWLRAVLAAPRPDAGWVAALIDSIAEPEAIPRFAEPIDAEAPAATVQTLSPASSPLIGRLFASQRALLAHGDLTSRLDSVARSIANALTAENRLADLAEWSTAIAAAGGSGQAAPVTGLLDRWLGQEQPEPAVPAAADPEQPESFRRRRTDTPDHEIKPANRILKVEQAKVDTLMTLIGELVVSKNSLPFLAKRAEQIHGSREMAREIKDVYAVIDRLAQEMQGSIMAVRMLPVSEVFERFPRLIRDVARKLGKQVQLKIEGEDTAADKNIIEVLGDPLLHILRNAIDHGIELPEERIARGKPGEALIRVRAFQEGDQVIIEVSDDGRGIDPVRIRASALAKGIIDANRAALLSDQDAVNLVFFPGFSTAETISDLSGRGVGMDVVANSVEKAGGTVTLSSAVGQGTLVRLSLPLSMAMTRVMMVEAAGGMLFGIPMDHIAETVRVRRQAIRRIKQAETLVLRNSIVPLLRLDRLLGVDAPIWYGDGDEEDAVLVVRIAGNLVGLVVDHFREGMDIILKPFDGILAGVPGYSGTALLGDGRVLLVLNLKELL